MKTLLFLLPVTLLAADSGPDYIVKEVRHELLSIPYYSIFDNLSYRVDGTKVTLFGQVVEPQIKDDAGKAVRKIEGVTSVDNEIEVLPLSPDDNRLRRALRNAIYSRPELERYALGAVPPIHIIVKRGDATLEGVVATQADKTVAGIAANSVPGVFSVKNNLRVQR